MWRSVRRRRPLAMAAAVAASLAGHLLLFAALLRSVPPRHAPPLRPVAVEMVELPRPPATVPDAPAPPRRLAGGKRRHPAGAGPREPPPGSAAASTSKPAAAPLDEGLEAAPSERAAPYLRPRFARAPAPPASDDVKPKDGAHELRRWLSEQAGRARVQSGFAHPYHSDLGKALARNWDVERAVKARGLPGYLAEAGGSLKTVGRSWLSMAEAYGRTGAPSAIDGGSERVREIAGLPPGLGRDSMMQAEIVRQLRLASSKERVATIRVVQAKDGRVKFVELQSPSSDAAVDREAMAAVRRTVAALGAPPADALAGRDELVTVWEFEIEVSITPPIPLVAVEFDEVLGGIDARMPLDRRIWKKVRLVATY